MPYSKPYLKSFATVLLGNSITGADSPFNIHGSTKPSKIKINRCNLPGCNKYKKNGGKYCSSQHSSEHKLMLSNNEV